MAREQMAPNRYPTPQKPIDFDAIEAAIRGDRVPQYLRKDDPKSYAPPKHREVGNFNGTDATRVVERATVSEDNQPATPMPDYVEHAEGVSQVGRLSAEAVVREYEAAAKQVEAMGDELQLTANKAETTIAEIHRAIAYVKETADHYRQEGKKLFDQIEASAKLATEVTDTCKNLRDKIAHS